MSDIHLISAIGTPLTVDETLHVRGLEAQLELQWRNGITGVLAGGSMGTMQMLGDATYADLVRSSAELVPAGHELMIGVGDISFARTCDRIHLVNRYKRVDGVAVLTPYLWKFTQAELIGYYHALADESRAPLYLYDLPQLTGLKVEVPTVLKVCEHKNIRGIKCSDSAHETRVLIEALRDTWPDFRVIVAQPLLLDLLVSHGVRDHLDGVYALVPEWAAAIARHSAAGETGKAAAVQRDLIALVNLIRSMNAFTVFTTIMNARNIPGQFAPKPFKPLTPEQNEIILTHPTIQKLLAGRQAALP